MAQQLIHLPEEISNLAEGSLTQEFDVPQPPIDFNATVVSEAEKAHNPAETGLVSAVEIEAKEKGDSQDAPLTKEETAPEKKAVETTQKAPVILIIEDTTELAEIIQATLERMNMVTVHETHGQKAIAKFKEMKPDVILLDISLPDMTGWQIMDALKQHSLEGGKLPNIIVITAYDDPANRLVGKLQGVYSYLIKPFTSDEIEKAVMQAISSATS